LIWKHQEERQLGSGGALANGLGVFKK